MWKTIIFVTLSILFFVNFVNSLSVDSVFVDSVSPGGEGIIRVNVENDGNGDIRLLSFRLEFSNSRIIPLGSSEAFINRLREDDDEIFAFRFKVANDLPAGIYSIGYIINYEENNKERQQKGIIGVVVSGEPDLDVVVDAQNAIVGQRGRLNVRIINKGLADARFVNILLDSQDFTFLSEKSEHVGVIDSDDFETSNFDIIYNEKFASLIIRIKYKDFDNNEREIVKITPVRAYTSKEAIEKGILKKSNVSIYVGIIFLLLFSWAIFRIFKRIRKKKI